MKKFFGTLFLAILAISLVACKDKDNKTNDKYVYNGTFTAFKEGINYGSPQLSWVSVTVEDGEIAGFNIDEVQSKDGVWNKKTKKQLKDEYGMANVPGTIGVEWYLQAEFLENFFLEHGADVDYDGEGFPTDEGLLTGTTMKIDIYVELALEALLNWKEGKYSAINYSLNYGAAQYTWVEMNVKGDEIVSFNIDELQSGKNEEDKFAWNNLTKKALKEKYGMKPASPIGKEWYEQAQAIEDHFLNESISSILMSGSGHIQNIAGATMIGDTYVKLATQCVNYFKAPTVIK